MRPKVFYDTPALISSKMFFLIQPPLNFVEASSVDTIGSNLEFLYSIGVSPHSRSKERTKLNAGLLAT